MLTRRRFLQLSAAGGALGAAVATGAVPLAWDTRRALASALMPGQVPLLGRAIPKWVDPLPHFAGNRIDGTRSLTVTMAEFQQKVLPASAYAALPPPYGAGTYVWGYGISDGQNAFGPLYPAFSIEARRGTPTTVTYGNNLLNPVLQKYLTVDQTLHWADPLMQMGSMQPYQGPVPAVTHLHGGEVPSAFDGGPDSWFTPGRGGKRISGPGFVSNTYTYPNAQEAATLWFHDHALGVTRLNVYAGLAGFYFLRDSRDTGLPGNPIGLPAGPQEVEIVIQDRMFDTKGQWFFPDVGINPQHPFWIPEFVGDAIVVNGKTWPYLNVEPRRYRFRFLDGSNARFYRMFLENMVTTTPGPVFWQIGTDGGLLDAPVKIDPNDPLVPRLLLLAPGERADIIIDFAAFAGQTLTLRNIARTPFPRGGTADPQTTGQIMQFRVTLPFPGPDTTYDPASGAPLRSPMVRLASAGALAPGVTPNATRQLTLNEVMGPGGPLEVLVNNTKWDGTLSPNAGGITEMPRVGSTEVWEIINLTADAHPIHLHLVQFQLLNRQNFNVNNYNGAYNAAFPGGMYMPAYGPPMAYGMPNADGALGGNPAITPYLQGPATPPEPNEEGWKDTVIMYPGQVTRVVVRWAPQDVPVGGVGAGTNRYPFDPTAGMKVKRDRYGYPGGPGYVWHCHIIDHEDNEMMRPQQVAP